MKNVIFYIVLLASISITSCGKDALKYDFSKIKSHADTKGLIAKIQLENEDEDIDSTSSFEQITIKGMHYAGVPIKEALITDNYTLLTTDTLNFSAKNLLEAIEANNGLINLTDSYSDRLEFGWKDETEDKTLKINLVNGKHLAAFGDKDYAELTINYKPIYTIPLANIHKEIKTFDNQAKYVLNTRSYDCVYDIIVNDIIITESSNETEFNLNNYIVGPDSSIKIIVKPRQKDGAKAFNEQAYFTAAIVNNENEEIIEAIEKTALKGSTPIVFQTDFNSTLPYYPKAWTDGADLRNDERLKDKVIALYDKLGKAMLAKDEQALNDIFYQKDFEMQQLDFDTNFEPARSEWETYLSVQLYCYKYTVANDFDIEFNSGGKLIYTYAKDKSDMIIFTGKGHDFTLNHYLYQPKGSNELKIIR
ncbi:hypothetical protein JBL43_11265 [Aureibaculum sp. A20]|uniref:Uncharacterized protein n=1 Tax=Aureibaculum flavum TaxID=2795986 RepID=A0ABS0WS66_9FLAO|nr:hypothetical protein [Aureibaculum flavum]MBJ2174819.1 hypothetical protein [Aureibaculum flavum]